MAKQIIPGEKFTELTAIKRIPKNGKHTTRWLCKCSCGKSIKVISSSLRGGNTRSCGCMTAHWRAFKHGLIDTRIYRIWAGMLQRCNNPKSTGYRHYGGRGIRVCERWHVFANFLADMGECPPDKTLDRSDNNGHYCKENCEWKTQQEQCNNTRVNHHITHNGETLTITQWEERLGICNGAINWRLKNGWTIEEACTTKSLRK